MESYELAPVIINNDNTIEHSARVCSVCNCGMLSGYVLFDGQDYACSDKCLFKLDGPNGQKWTLAILDDYFQERENDYSVSDCYWTDWYECDEYECHICEQIFFESKQQKGKNNE